MKDKIRILLVEDDEGDANLISETLRNSGLTFTLERVENEVDFIHELQECPADVILSDHGFPAFDGFKALELARNHCPEVPFIFVIGALGEDMAIASFKNGATDYVLKGRLRNCRTPLNARGTKLKTGWRASNLNRTATS